MGFDTSIDRRKFLRIGTIAVASIGIAGTGIIVKTLVDTVPTFPDVTDRTSGESTISISPPWYDVLPKIRIGERELSRDDISTITRTAEPIPYSRACNCDGKFNLSVKHGLSLEDVRKQIGLGQPTSRLTRVDATDLYSLVSYENIFLSASLGNLPEKYLNDEGLKKAQELEMTPYSVFLPYREKGGAAWMDLNDVSSISTPDNSARPGTYFRLPSGEFAQKKSYYGNLYPFNLALKVTEGDRTVEIPYQGDLRTLAENNVVKFRWKKVPFIPLEEIVQRGLIEQKDFALVVYADGYTSVIHSRLQENMGFIVDDQYIKDGSPLKVVGEHLKKASLVHGVREIEILPMRA